MQPASAPPAPRPAGGAPKLVLVGPARRSVVATQRFTVVVRATAAKAIRVRLESDIVTTRTGRSGIFRLPAAIHRTGSYYLELSATSGGRETDVRLPYTFEPPVTAIQPVEVNDSTFPNAHTMAMRFRPSQFGNPPAYYWDVWVLYPGDRMKDAAPSYGGRLDEPGAPAPYCLVRQQVRPQPASFFHFGTNRCSQRLVVTAR